MPGGLQACSVLPLHDRGKTRRPWSVRRSSAFASAPSSWSARHRERRRDGARAGRVRPVQPPRRAASGCRLRRPALRLAGLPPTVPQRSSSGTRGEGSPAAHREQPLQCPRPEKLGAARPVCRRGQRGRSRDPRDSGAPRPRQAALETFRHGSPRISTAGHRTALAVVPFSVLLPSDSFPSRAKRSDTEAAGWLSP